MFGSKAKALGTDTYTNTAGSTSFCNVPTLHTPSTIVFFLFSSLSYVSIFGIQKDAGLVGKQYSWLGSILYLAQLVMQPLAAFLAPYPRRNWAAARGAG